MKNDPRVLEQFAEVAANDPRQMFTVNRDGAGFRMSGWFGGMTRAASFDDAAYTSVGMSSTRDLDRYAWIIEPDGWDLENYLRNPVVLVNHKDFGSDGIPIGKSVLERIVKDGLESTTKFAVAETSAVGSHRVAEIWALHRGGYFPALSVSLLPKEWEEFQLDLGDGSGVTRGVRCIRQEKLEHSLVSLPGNALALTKSMARLAVASARHFGLSVPDSDLPGDLGVISRACQLTVESEDLARSIAGQEASSSLVRAEIDRIRTKYRLAPEPNEAISREIAVAVQRLRAAGSAIRSALN